MSVCVCVVCVLCVCVVHVCSACVVRKCVCDLGEGEGKRACVGVLCVYRACVICPAHLRMCCSRRTTPSTGI